MDCAIDFGELAVPHLSAYAVDCGFDFSTVSKFDHDSAQCCAIFVAEIEICVPFSGHSAWDRG